MGEFIKDKYYILVRMILMLLFCIYGVVSYAENYHETGVSFKILLLVLFFIALMAIKEQLGKRYQIVILIAAAILLVFLIRIGGWEFILLGFYLIYEFLTLFDAKMFWYFCPYLFVFMKTPVGYLTQFLVITMLMLCYVQYIFIVSVYRKQMMEETKAQQGLKRDIEKVENETKVELKRNILESENRILEERAQLSQTLHDKLGHNINGSIYQLEATKVIMDKDPEKARTMIQAVIDQLRTGMDEIRAILRKERPDKKQMALLQIYELCEDCNKKGVEAELNTEGDLSRVPADLWEVILDNAFEAVTNSMKYSRCKHINIEIVAMNKMVRCIISDDGIGCDRIVDGMGISGMRHRIRAAGGSIDFESEAGFKVNMLLPI